MDVWLPHNLRRDPLTDSSLAVVGRLHTGVSLNQAPRRALVLSHSMKERWPDVRASGFVAVPLHDDVVAPSRTLVQLLVIAVGLVLLVACVNVANLVSSGRRVAYTSSRFVRRSVPAAAGWRGS